MFCDFTQDFELTGISEKPVSQVLTVTLDTAFRLRNVTPEAATPVLQHGANEMVKSVNVTLHHKHSSLVGEMGYYAGGVGQAQSDESVQRQWSQSSMLDALWCK